MAYGVDFEGANAVFRGDGKRIYDLPTFHAEGPPAQIISAWRLSAEELLEVQKTGVVWLSVYGHQLAPVLVSGTALVNIEEDGVKRPSRAEPVMPRAPSKEQT